eukprot:3156135-Rhodomonas_salina.5
MAYGATRSEAKRRSLRSRVLWSYARATRCPAYSYSTLRACSTMSSTEIAYASMVRRACYVMSGTEAAIDLRACYAMSGTEIAYAEPGERRHLHLLEAPLHVAPYPPYALPTPCPTYAMPGTEFLYAPTPSPVLTAVSARWDPLHNALAATCNVGGYELQYVLCDAWY